MLQNLNLGAAPNDKTGTPAREAGNIINNNFAYLESSIEAKLVDSTIINEVTTSSAIPSTGNIHAIGVGPGTYTNWGGMVVPANNIGTLQRVGSTYSVSLTAIDLTGKVNVSDVINTLVSSETAKPGSANNDRLLKENKADKTQLDTKADLLVGKNKFNKDTLVLDNYSTETGAIGSIAGLHLSDYIPVLPAEVYNCNQSIRWSTYYDIDKNVVAGGKSAAFSGSYTIPASVYFKKVTLDFSADKDTFQIELGTSETFYENYEKFIPDSQIKLTDYLKLIDIENKADVLPLKNLFDKTDAEIQRGFYLNGTGGLVALSIYSVTGYIPVLAGQTVICNKNAGGGAQNCFFDVNKVFVPSSNSNAAAKTATVDGFVRYTIAVNDSENINVANVQIENGSTSTVYGEYIKIVPNSQLNLIEYAKTADILTTSKNLFIVETAIDEAFANWVNGTVSTEYPSGACSDFIKVTPGTVYSCNSTQTYKAFYDNAQVFVSGSQLGTYPVTIPSGCEYIRITVGIDQKESVQFEEGANQTFYVKGGNNAVYPYIEDGVTLKLTTFGDSIVYQNRWQNKLCKELRFLHTNIGIGGTAVAGGADANGDFNGFWTTQRIAQIPTDTDVLILNGGANDYARSYAIGVLDSTNTNEFYGALNKWVERAMARVPNAKIFIATTTYGEYPSFSADPNYADANGKTTKDFATAMKNIAFKYGFPCIDFNGNCMVNKWNRPTLAPDGLHPETVFADRMSNVAIDVMRDLV
jgi:hypothetical protein